MFIKRNLMKIVAILLVLNSIYLIFNIDENIGWALISNGILTLIMLYLQTKKQKNG